MNTRERRSGASRSGRPAAKHREQALAPTGAGIFVGAGARPRKVRVGAAARPRSIASRRSAPPALVGAAARPRFFPLRSLVLALGMVGALSQSACAPYRFERPAPPVEPADVINPPPSVRGNPPVYEVLGERYYVSDSAEGYRERGVASWYGRKFHGRATSSGEVYDMYALTAAHKTLPIPTWVEVTHLSTGKQVIVKVNDRGPFVDKRLIDLSYGAAQALGMVQQGTARVEVRALGVPAGGGPIDGSVFPVDGETRTDGGFSLISTAVADAPWPGERPVERVFLQVGAFSDRDNAERLVKRLEAGGYDAAFVVSQGEGRHALHRVRIGPIDDLEQLDHLAAGLPALGLNDSHLVVER